MPVKGRAVPINSGLIGLLKEAEERIVSSAQSYYVPEKIHVGSRPEDLRRFRTTLALATDTRRLVHFEWAKRWSTDPTELANLKDGVRSVINASDAIDELYAWRHRFRVVREQQLRTPGNSVEPDATNWAKLLPLARKEDRKQAIAQALATARRLVFTHSGDVKRPEDPSRRLPP
eukprot:SAG31_NODE_11339_length_1040_cov_3.178533_1_plen_174_part_01